MGFFSAHTRFCIPLCLDYFFVRGGGVLPLAYSQDARTDFDAKKSEDAVPRKDVPFGGPEPIL